MYPAAHVQHPRRPRHPRHSEQPPAPTVAEPACPVSTASPAPSGRTHRARLLRRRAPAGPDRQRRRCARRRRPSAPRCSGPGSSLGAVRHLFNTHGHWDHMGGNEACGRSPRLPHVRPPGGCLPPGGRRAARGGYVHDPVPAPGATRRGGRPRRRCCAARWAPRRRSTSRRGRGAVRPRRGPRPAGPAHAGALPGLHQLPPGRGEGRCAGALFTGDGVQGLGSRPGQLPLIFDDSHAYRATIARLSDVPFSALCLGHSFCGLGQSRARPGAPTGRRRGPTWRRAGRRRRRWRRPCAACWRRARPGRGLPERGPGHAGAAWRGPWAWSWTRQGLSPRSVATLHAFYRELTGAPLPVRGVDAWRRRGLGLTGPAN